MYTMQIKKDFFLAVLPFFFCDVSFFFRRLI